HPTPPCCFAHCFSIACFFFQAVTKKKFGGNDFRSALENGVLLCDLINKIKPGLIKRVNRLPTPIAGLDNLNVFLKACVKLGLKEAQLFHPGDLQDLSTRVTVKHQETNRRLKNVLITIYWLGRRAQCDRFYDGPYLNFKAFEGLLGTALYKALQESSGQKGSNVRDSGFGDSWYSEREELYHLRGGGGGGGGHRRDDSLDSLDSLGSQPHSISSDATLKGSSEGCCSDTEADSVFKMAENRDSLSYRRSVVITPKSSAPFNQFLPTKDKPSGYVPAPLRKKRAERNEDNRRSWANPSNEEDEGTLTRYQNSRIDLLKRFCLLSLQDLSKWKNRRRSVNSDIVKKKEEREKIEQITYGVNRRSKTFKEMQEESDSTTIITPSSRRSFNRSPSPPAAPSQRTPVSEHTVTTKKEEATSVVSSSTSLQKVPEPRRSLLGTQSETEAPSSGSLLKQQPQLSSMEPKPPGVSRVTASLPRTFQRSDSARLTSVVTPRPFGTQSSRITSLPRAFTVTYANNLTCRCVATVIESQPYVCTHESRLCSPVLLFGFQGNHCEMRISLNQKPNSSRDFGFQAAWDSTGARVTSIQPGSSAEMCRLQVGDEVVMVNGHQVAEMSYTEWKSHMEEALQEGSLVMDIRRHGQNSESSQCVCLFVEYPQVYYHFTSSAVPHCVLFSISHVESEPISLKNLKRRSEFFETGKKPKGLTEEEERKRQEKWQKEQERLLQVYTKEERKRKVEQERQRQAEERRKREEEERELQRLQEERKRRERQEEEERRRREEDELRWQRRKEEEREEERRRQELAEQQRREKERALEQQQQWSVDPPPPVTNAPLHADNNTFNPLYRVCINIMTGSGVGERKGQQPTSQAEVERQQILNEMKKKTPLLTDSSWIRQRSSSTAVSKENDIPPMRRGESLDNLDSTYNSWRSSWGPRSSSFAQNLPRPHSALSGSTSSFYGGGSGLQRPGSATLPSSYSMGSLRGAAGTPSSPWSRQSLSPSLSSPSSVSGRKICTFCDTPLGKGAAMIIESLGLCYHLGCFKCIDCKSDLGGSEAGAEVRIRNKQLYCNSCYMRFKSERLIKLALC
uniref:LIM domain 7a n=1 Tax=Amphiprion percula TaxID=161767 RepID=A0A3P8S306_AMPPE